MLFKNGYLRAKQRLLTDQKICKPNRDLFAKFFEYEEYKLQRQNGLMSLDEATYNTLSGYVNRLRNVNLWFNNKPWKDLTKHDIKRVYDGLEDGTIVNKRGMPFKDRRSYYNKIFKSKPFQMAGKADLAREAISFYTDRQEKVVRFLDKTNHRKLVSVSSNPLHLALFWLAWDVGENINTLLNLRKRDFTRQVNPDTQEPEYLVNFPKEHLKRSRQVRSEPTLYSQTVQYLDLVLDPLARDDRLFHFQHRQATKILKSAMERSGAVCCPQNDSIKWKDFRSGMACHLLKQGWTTDEVNFRLGHKPSSREIDVYVSHLAIDRRKPKKKLHDASLRRIEQDLEAARHREKQFGQRLRRQQEENDNLRSELNRTRDDLRHLREQIEQVLATRKKAG